jgi:hypothetical protein
MLLDELRAWSGPPPSDDALSVAVDHIARSAEQEAAGRTGVAPTFGMLAGDLKNLSRIFRNGLANDISDPNGRDPYYLPPDSSLRGLAVILDAEAQRTLEDLGKDRQFWDVQGGVGPGERARRGAQPQFVPVRLEPETEEYEIGGDRGGTLRRPVVAAHVGRHRLGRLSAEDSSGLDHDLREARQQGRTIWMGGRYLPPETGTPARLLLYPGPLPFP